MSNIDPSGLKTKFLITRGSLGIGNHIAVYIDNGGDPILYDPGGSYATEAGDYAYGDKANVDKFEKFHKETFNDTTEIITFDTTEEDEKKIYGRITEGMGNYRVGLCAVGVSASVSGIGPFKDLNGMYLLPGSLGKRLRGLVGK